MKNKLSAKDVLTQFLTTYREVYEVNYSPNWGRDIKLVKSKLLGTFTDEQIKDIVDISVREYGDRWANVRFPRPSIGAICSWLANKAIAVKQERDKEDKLVEQRSSVDVNKYLSKL